MSVLPKYISLIMFIVLFSCNSKNKNMSTIKNTWEQLVNSKTINEEITAITHLKEASKENGFSFMLFVIDESGNKIHYNDFNNQKVKSVSVDFYVNDSEYNAENWKPLDVNNISLLFLE